MQSALSSISDMVDSWWTTGRVSKSTLQDIMAEALETEGDLGEPDSSGARARVCVCVMMSSCGNIRTQDLCYSSPLPSTLHPIPPSFF